MIVRRKLKSYVIPTFILIIALMGITTFAVIKNFSIDDKDLEENLTYVSNIVMGNETAVINTETKTINPYTDATVKIGKYYYDYQGEAKNQEKAIIFHDNTYMQNSGVDFVSENIFDVVSILDGTVVNVKDDETLGKIVEIKHNNDYISIYQSLDEVTVKKDDQVTQGQVIGKSGTNELDKEIGNHLHFELYINGQSVDPTLYLNKNV